MITWFCVKRQKIDDAIGRPQYPGHEGWGESKPIVQVNGCLFRDNVLQPISASLWCIQNVNIFISLILVASVYTYC